MADCCPVMTLALERTKPTDKMGLFREPSWNYKTGGIKDVVIVRFRRGKTRSEEHADATFAECSFCPFCGAGLLEKKPTVRRRGRGKR